jgi:hypothetical protein
MGWVLLGICVVGGLAVPLTREMLPRYKPTTETLPLKPETTVALSLAEAEFQGEGAQRIIVGVVRNDSPARRTGVVVTFELHANSDSLVSLAVGKIASISPHGVGQFRTNPVPPQVRRFLVRDIVAEQE